jgi:anti-sigma factor RsiW
MTHTPTPQCRDLLGSISDSVDGLLQEELCHELEKHLSECENCRVVVDTFKKTIYLYHSTSSEVHVPAGVRERLFKRLNLEGYMNQYK